MTSSDRSRPTRDHTDPEARAELDRAAADLEALADAHEDCTIELETVESTVDALLDDDSAHLLLLDGERKVTGISRGLAGLFAGERPVLGRPLAAVVPPAWSGLEDALGDLSTAEGWRTVPVEDGEGRLFVRRATDEAHPAAYVVRYEPHHR